MNSARVLDTGVVTSEAAAPPPKDAVSTGMPRVHSLDGLRGIASLLVVGHHLGAQGVADALEQRGFALLSYLADTIGASGVELFFVLSGLVLSRPYVIGNRKFEVRTYAVRRINRLFPPYIFAWLIAGLAIYVVTYHENWWTRLAMLPKFDWGDWFAQIGILYFGKAHYSFAWWSLGLEVMFYIVVPLIIPLVFKIPPTSAATLGVLGFSVMVAIVGPILFPWLWHVQGEFGRLVHYCPCFVAGLVLARAVWSPRVAWSVGAVGLALLLLSHYDTRLHEHVGYGLIYTALLSRCLDRSSACARMFGNWHLVWLGERSYSLFLVHAPIMILTYYASALFVENGPGFLLCSRVLALVSSFLVAMMSFHWIERVFARGLVTGESFWPIAPRTATLPVTAGST